VAVFLFQRLLFLYSLPQTWGLLLTNPQIYQMRCKLFSTEFFEVHFWKMFSLIVISVSLQCHLHCFLCAVDLCNQHECVRQVPTAVSRSVPRCIKSVKFLSDVKLIWCRCHKISQFTIFFKSNLSLMQHQVIQQLCFSPSFVDYCSRQFRLVVTELGTTWLMYCLDGLSFTSVLSQHLTNLPGVQFTENFKEQCKTNLG